jgi:hypothetical protein
LQGDDHGLTNLTISIYLLQTANLLFGSHESPRLEACDAPAHLPTSRAPIRAPAASPVRPAHLKFIAPGHGGAIDPYQALRSRASPKPETERTSRLSAPAAEPSVPSSSTKEGTTSSTSRRTRTRRVNGSDPCAADHHEEGGSRSSVGGGGDYPEAKPRAGPTKASSALQLSAAQLQQITNQNTARNRQHYNRLDTVTVYRDVPRPPSPSAKIRRASGRPQTKESTKTSREDRARKRQALGQTLRGDDDADRGDSAESGISMALRKHFLAAGDEEGGFESPVKLQRSKKVAKMVKWDKGLIKDPPAEPSVRERIDESKFRLRRIVKVCFLAR